MSVPNEPEEGSVHYTLPVNLKWMPRYSESTLKVAPWLIMVAAGVALAGVVTLYYTRSSPSLPSTTPTPGATTAVGQAAVESTLGAGEVARTATDFAVVLLVAGVAIVLIGVVLVLGEVLKAVHEAKKAEATVEGKAAGVRALVGGDAANVISKTIEALVSAAKALTPGRLLIIIGAVPIVLSAWVAQSATTVTLTGPDPAPVVSESPDPAPSGEATSGPGGEPSEAPTDGGATSTPEPEASP